MPTAEESLSAFDSEEDTPVDVAAPRLFTFESESDVAMDLPVVRPVAPSSAPAPEPFFKSNPIWLCSRPLSFGRLRSNLRARQPRPLRSAPSASAGSWRL